MRLFFRYLVRVLVLVVVFMASVLTAMRFAIHGRQTTIPKLVGMTSGQAAGQSNIAGSGARDAGTPGLACPGCRKHGAAAGRHPRPSGRE
jgi:hypothetical protein